MSTINVFHFGAGISLLKDVDDLILGKSASLSRSPTAVVLPRTPISTYVRNGERYDLTNSQPWAHLFIAPLRVPGPLFKTAVRIIF